MLPARAQGDQGAANFHLRDFGIRSGDHRGGFALGQFQQLAVARISWTRRIRPACRCAGELAQSAQLGSGSSDLEAVVRADHGVEPALALFCYFATSHQDAVGLRRSAPNAPAQLVKLRQAKAFGVLNHHYGCVRHVHAHFNHRGRDQNLQLAFRNMRMT